MTEVACFLPDRGIVAVDGADAVELLNRLFTNSMLDMAPRDVRYAAFLSPQGKLLFDFLVIATGAGCFLLDCLLSQAPDLAKRLNFQKLRAKVVVVDRSAELGVAAAWGDAPPAMDGILMRDPRQRDLGWRIVGARNGLTTMFPAAASRYDAHRISCGVPQGGIDFAFGDAFVHDANLDQLNGVDFKKGCYVGQEVVARVHFRKSARKRIVPVRFDAAPATGTDIVAGTLAIGTIGSVTDTVGLALVRLDRLADATNAAVPLTADGHPVTIDVPDAFTAG